MKNFKSWPLVIFVFLALAAILWLAREPLAEFLRFVGDRAAFSEYIRSFGLLGPLVLACLHVLQVIISMLPGDVFFLAAGYVYGLPIGFALNLTVTVFAGFLAFSIARRWGRPVVNRLAPAHIVDRWDSAAKKHGFVFFLMSFMLPLFPTDTMNYVAGLSLIPWRQFVLAQILGRGPLIFLFTLLGAHGTELGELGFSSQVWVLIGVVVAILYISWIYFFRKFGIEIFSPGKVNSDL